MSFDHSTEYILIPIESQDEQVIIQSYAQEQERNTFKGTIRDPVGNHKLIGAKNDLGLKLLKEVTEHLLKYPWRIKVTTRAVCPGYAGS